MTSGHKVSLWKPGGHNPHPSVPPEGCWRKGLTEVEKDGVKVRKTERREPREGGSEWESDRWRGGEREKEREREGWAKISGKEKRRESERVGWERVGCGAQRHWLSGSWLGARAECLVWKQAEQCAAAKPEIQLCRKRAPSPSPNLHSHLLPSPPASITPSITLCIPPLDRLPFRLSNTFKQARWVQWNTPDGLQPSKSQWCYCSPELLYSQIQFCQSGH